MNFYETETPPYPFAVHVVCERPRMKYSCDIGKRALFNQLRIVIRVSAYQFLLCKEETQVFWRHHDVHSINNNMYCILYREYSYSI